MNGWVCSWSQRDDAGICQTWVCYKNERFYQAAWDAYAFEQHYYEAKRYDWKDLRYPDEESSGKGLAWRHGSCGAVATKKFKDATVLDHVSLTIEKGSICGLNGCNGSGKTVLMKVICGFVFPDSGSVSVRDKRIGKDCDFPENVGIIIETPNFSPFLSGFSNLKSLASIRKKIDEDKVRKTMELVGLDPASKKWVSKYSLGMRQRLGIAQAIMEDQDLLVLDEPMNGLDKQGAADVRELLLRMKEEGKTILLASHNAQDIEILCDKVYEVDGGKVTEMKKTAGAKSLIEVRSVTKRYGTKKRIQLLAEWINKNEKKYLNN